MTNRSGDQLGFPRCIGLRVEADFSGGNVTSDAGVLLLRQADRYLGLTVSIARLLEDPRRQPSCEHSVLSMPRQRVYGLATGNPAACGRHRNGPRWGGRPARLANLESPKNLIK